MPTLTLSSAEAAAGIGLIDLLRRTGVVESNGEARRLIQGGGVRLGELRADDDKKLVKASDFSAGVLTLRAGKKKVFRVVIAS